MRPTAERIRQLLKYDPGTGLFFWQVRVKGSWRSGRPNAGGPRRDGGWRLKIDKREFPAAVIAFVYMTGRWPKGDVDHRDCDRSNNRWNNLREATRSQNIANQRYFPHSAPYKGVGFDKQTGRWRARIRVRGKFIDLGRHSDPESAHLAYVAAAHKHFGEFARDG